jgi:hypothetical protein
MKLDRGNPNLMRVNPNAGLAAVPNKLGDKNPARYVRGGYVPMEKGPNAVAAPAMNLWERPVYKPDNSKYIRPGANDFLTIKSRGF